MKGELRVRLTEPNQPPLAGKKQVADVQIFSNTVCNTVHSWSKSFHILKKAFLCFTVAYASVCN
jgi:hypothetical protein